MSDTSTSRGRFRAKLFALLLLAAIVAGTFTLVYKAAAAKRAFRVSGDTTDIRLIGVIPDGGDEILDPATGKPAVGPDGALRPRMVDYDDRFSVWENNELRRTFVFEVPSGSPPLHFLHPIVVRASGTQLPADNSKTFLLTHSDGRTVAHLKTLLNSTYSSRRLFGFLRRASPLDMVDVTLRYFVGDERGTPDAAFAGPFTHGDLLKDEATGSYSLTVKALDPARTDPVDGISEVFVITGTGSASYGAPFNAYDKFGAWRLAWPGGGTNSAGMGKTTFSYEYMVRDVPLKDITRVTFNEKPRTTVFHNVRVAYPGKPKRTYAPYLDELAKRLDMPGFDPEALANHRALSGRQAIDCIDLWRGHSIPQAWSAVAYGEPPLRPGDLDENDLERVHQTALAWLGADAPLVRLAAVQFGLWGGWHDFFIPAMEIVRSDSRYRADAAYALSQFGPDLTDDEVRQIADFLVSDSDAAVHTQLLRAVAAKLPAPAAVDAFAEMMQSDNVAIWWLAFQRSRHTSPEMRSRLAALAAASPEFHRRAILTLGPGEVGEEESPQLVEAAYASLPALLDPDLLRISDECFFDIVRLLNDRTPKEKASASVVRFLRTLVDNWDEYDTPSSHYRTSVAIAYCVKYLNAWNGVNIAWARADLNRDPSEIINERNCLAAATEALNWADTGVPPNVLPAGWTMPAGAIRIVWLNNSLPESSVIAFCRPPAADAAYPVLLWLESAADFLSLDIAHQAAGADSIYNVYFRAGVLQHGYVGGSFDVTSSARPVALPSAPRWQSDWAIYFEDALATDSVLRGTSLFDQWQSTYLSGAPLAAPAPVVLGPLPVSTE